MNISIIIPAKNSQRTLARCLDAIYGNTFKPCEVMVVDCGSEDLSYRDIVKKYPATVLTVKAGKGTARSVGIAKATGELLVLIDADIVIPDNALQQVVDTFQQNPGIDIMNGLLAKECPYTDFFSQYKNLYMNYRFKKMPDEIDFLFTSFTAFRRNTVVTFKDTIKPKDTETGQRLAKEQGHPIFFNRNLEVLHLKRYDFWSILYNDFIVSYGWAKIFWRFAGIRDIATKGRFAHSTNDQIAAVIVAFLSAAGLPVAVFIPPLAIIPTAGFFVFLLLQHGFIRFLIAEKGRVYATKATFFTLLDNVVMGTAIGCGFVTFFKNALVQRQKKASPKAAKPRPVPKRGCACLGSCQCSE